MNKLTVFILMLAVASSLRAQHADFEFRHHCAKYQMNAERSNSRSAAVRSDTIDIIHTQINLRLVSIQSQTIEARTRLFLQSKQNGVQSVRLDFEGLTVDSVMSGGQNLAYAHQGATLDVDFGQVLNDGDTVSIIVIYHGEPIKDASGWGGFYFQAGYAWNLGVGFAADPHSYGRIWFPCFDNFVERSTFDFFIRVPDPLRPSCNGELIAAMPAGGGYFQYHWQIANPIPSYLTCITIGQYERVEWNHTGINTTYPVVLYAKASDTTDLKSSFTHLDDAIEAFELAYGPYSWNKVGYSLVPFNAGAMEHATNITYPIYAASGNLAQEDLMTHELAHMWWGDLITCSTDEDMWLNEGWASFSEYVAAEHIYGRDAYEQDVMEELLYVLRYIHHFEEGFRPVSGQPHEYVYGDHVYKKGALVAHNLRGYMGDSAFFGSIPVFQSNNAFSDISSEELRDELGSIAGQDLQLFFKNWVFEGGFNSVVLDSFSTESAGAAFSTSLWLHQKVRGRATHHEKTPVYFTAFDSNWETYEGMTWLDGERQMKTIELPFEPVWMVLNEGNQMAWSRTSAQKVVQDLGGLDFDYALIDVNVESVSDSALLRIDHHWVAPDGLKDFTKPYRLSTERYWEIHGLNLEKLALSGQVFYDGRNTGSNGGYLDLELMDGNEDSLLLVYRSDTEDDWTEYQHYSKNTLGPTTDEFGVLMLDTLLPGQYAFAMLDYSSVGSAAIPSESTPTLFPNPANGMVRVEAWASDSFMVFDSSGKIVRRGQVRNQTFSFDVKQWSPGAYFVKGNASGEDLKLIVE